MDQCWYHGSITRSKAEDLLSKVGKDGSFLVRASESVSSAYALCLLYRNCVYTYRILPNKENKLVIQACEGVPVQYFNTLDELIEFYKKENMGLVRSLKFPVPHEEEETTDDLEEDQDYLPIPPVLPPRSISVPVSETKEEFLPSDNVQMSEVSKPPLSETLLQRLQHHDTSNIPEEHLKLIQDYLRVHITNDIENVQLGSWNLPQLKKLLTGLCKGLFNELSRTLPSLESIQMVFDQLSPGTHRHSQPSFDVNRAKLVQLTNLLSSIEDKVKRVLIEGPDPTHRRSLIPPVTFEVKADCLGISSKIHLKVDVEMGKLIIKKAKDGPEDKFYTHKKILQLIKSQKFPNKLVIVLETEKEKAQRKEYVFADSKKREGFCQLLQQMKNKHSEQPEPDMITIFIGTWNMGDAPPPKKISSWFLSKGQGKTRDETADYIPHDIYVIGTQEDSLGEKEWQEILRHSLQEITSISFKVIATHTLWNIRTVVLAKPEHENRISHLCVDTVKTGIANRLGNKGAVGVSFMFNGTSFGFVNSHLTSGSEKKQRRNQNYMSILRFMSVGDKNLSPFNITHRFTHFFWLGDLNYRLELSPTEAENIVQKIKQQQYTELLNFDQLLIEKKDQKVFLQLEEEEITFAPTYRFERNTRENYVYTKQKATGMKYNLPSWCDRVLWKSYPLVHVVCQSYARFFLRNQGFSAALAQWNHIHSILGFFFLSGSQQVLAARFFLRNQGFSAALAQWNHIHSILGFFLSGSQQVLAARFFLRNQGFSAALAQWNHIHSILGFFLSGSQQVLAARFFLRNQGFSSALAQWNHIHSILGSFLSGSQQVLAAARKTAEKPWLRRKNLARRKTHINPTKKGCTTDIMTSDHSPVFATFEVAVTSQFVSKNDDKYTDSLGQIEFLHCSAVLKTKSQTKFYIEFYSSCLESFVKSQEGENEEGNEGELVVKFVEALPKLTPIISDPEYLLDQHILICIKSSDSDESYGEGCIALRSGAAESQVPIQTVLTHHGEKTGIFQGQFKLQTSQGKQREKLYDFVKTERDETAGQKSIRGVTCIDHAKEWEQINKVTISNRRSTHLVAKEAAAIARFRGTAVTLDEPCRDDIGWNTVPSETNNASFLRMAAASQPFTATTQFKQIPSPDQQPTLWNYDLQPKDNTPLLGLESPTTPSTLSPGSPRVTAPFATNRKDQLYSEVRKSMIEPLLQDEAYSKPEMIDNPLYDFTKSKDKLLFKREQELFKVSRKELPTIPDQNFPFTKLQETDGNKPCKQQSSPPFLVPTQRFRSYTCSNQSEENSTGKEKIQNKQKPCSNLDPSLSTFKNPIKLTRSEGVQNKPPLPSKSQVVLDMQHIKGRDYRESSELPSQRKHQNEDGTVGRAAVP